MMDNRTPCEVIANTEFGFADLRMGHDTALAIIWQLEAAGYQIVRKAETKWRPISEHSFPWEPSRLTVAVHAVDDKAAIEVFVCQCADGGHYYPDGEILALDEMGWVPYAWTDAPPKPNELRAADDDQGEGK